MCEQSWAKGFVRAYESALTPPHTHTHAHTHHHHTTTLLPPRNDHRLSERLSARQIAKEGRRQRKATMRRCAWTRVSRCELAGSSMCVCVLFVLFVWQTAKVCHVWCHVWCYRLAVVPIGLWIHVSLHCVAPGARRPPKSPWPSALALGVTLHTCTTPPVCPQVDPGFAAYMKEVEKYKAQSCKEYTGCAIVK